MHTRSYAILMGASVVLWAAGCGDSVSVVDGNSGGNGGAGNAGGNNVGGGTGGATTATTGGSGGVGNQGPGGAGGFANDCEEACAKATGCGFDACGALNVDCSTPDFDCQAACVLDADCAAIASITTQNPDPTFAGCVNDCAGGNNDCAQCSFSCVPADCTNGNADCQVWLNCLSGCGDPGCIDACDAASPELAAQQAEFYSCACTDCSMECETIMDPCDLNPQQ